MKCNLLFSAILLSFFFGCNNNTTVATKSAIVITDSIANTPSFDAIINPYKKRLDKDLNTVISYSTETYAKNNGEYNTAIGNLLADLVYSECNPVFNKRTDKNIDFVLLNHGGIRSNIPKGNITYKTAYNVMPFENSIVVVALKGTQIDALIHYLKHAKLAHPISGIVLEIDKNLNTRKALIQGKKIVKNKTYYVATNDYLLNGGDGMTFFTTNEGTYPLDYKIRHAIIDYLKKTDTIHPKKDNRFILTK